VLRLARPDDIAAIQRVRRRVRENRLVSGVITDDEVLAMMQVHGRGWVVDESGDVVAFAFGDARDGNIWALFVDPDHERRGHGRRLHGEMVRWLWSRGLERLWLGTDPGTRAQRFYEAAGWRAAGFGSHGELRFELDRPAAATQHRGHGIEGQAR
jgi:GNAT superfamily N-acetyltransferase